MLDSTQNTESMIQLLANYGSDAVIANTARVSFADFSTWGHLPEGYTEQDMKKLIIYLAKHKHSSPFRHVTVSIRCKAPIFIVRQLGKHQVGLSWNEVSRRYVDSPPTFHTLPILRNRPEASIKQGSIGIHAKSDYWLAKMATLTEECERVYLDMIADKVAPEQARAILPQSMNTEWIWTGSLLAFAHLYNERIASNAQEEVRLFAQELDAILMPLYPIAWPALTNRIQ